MEVNLRSDVCELLCTAGRVIHKIIILGISMMLTGEFYKSDCQTVMIVDDDSGGDSHATERHKRISPRLMIRFSLYFLSDLSK